MTDPNGLPVNETTTPQPAPITDSVREIKPPLIGDPVNQTATATNWRLDMLGACDEHTLLAIRGAASVTVKERSTNPKPYDYDFHAGLHTNVPAGVVALDRCRLKLGGNMLDQGACLEAGWAGVFRPLGGMPPIRTIRISPGRPKLHATPSAFSGDPYAMLSILEPGATPRSGIEYVMLGPSKKSVTMTLLLLDPDDNQVHPFTIKSGEAMRLDRAGNKVEPAPSPLEDWALEAMRRACRQSTSLCM
jgi:hypothetical protein